MENLRRAQLDLRIDTQHLGRLMFFQVFFNMSSHNI